MKILINICNSKIKYEKNINNIEYHLKKLINIKLIILFR